MFGLLGCGQLEAVILSLKLLALLTLYLGVSRRVGFAYDEALPMRGEMVSGIFSAASSPLRWASRSSPRVYAIGPP